jgi:histidyl-tRNA synthetase
MKPSLPQGTRDFSPETVRKRQHIFQVIRETFERYGFQPLETPAMENLETLLGKYGEEGDKLIFRILNNGLDHPNKQAQALEDFRKVLDGKSVKGITERALRYDLTIPFARYVAMNHGQLHFPFKRYQLQPVWRADRPQKGRYREFYQCDADVVGSGSLLNEAELANIYGDVFRKLGIPVEIRINNRKILAALAEACGGAGQMTSITVAIDKLDKIGLDAVKNELIERGLTPAQVNLIEQYLGIAGGNREKIEQASALLGHIPAGREGLDEISWLTGFLASDQVVVDFTLARGLNYYTGTIFEIKASGVQIGSIGGGGRYDDLTGLFGVPGIPGVGISFGVDRIYDVMEELRLFPEGLLIGTMVLFFNLGEQESRYAYGLMQELRQQGVSAEIYHESAKFDKQFKYAEKKRIPFIVIIGTNEMESGTCKVKNLQTGEQRELNAVQLAAYFKD